MSEPRRDALAEGDSDPDDGSPEWRVRQEELRLAELKKGLLMELDVLVQEATKVNRDNRMKEEEARKLTKRVAKLREGQKGLPKTGSENKSDGPNENDKDPIVIFPEEVWKMIFDLVSDPKDLWSCSIACPPFDKILRPWKTGWMLLHALPYLWRHLPRNKLLECRLVSKSWNGAVDSFLENHPAVRPHNEGQSDPRRLDFIYPLKEKRLCRNNYFFFNNNDPLTSPLPPRLLNSLNFPRMVDRNPFIGRNVKIQLGRWWVDDDQVEDQPEDPWWEQFYSFLDTFGKEIWYIHLVLPSEPNTRVQGKLLQFLTSKLFQSLPNLRKLNLDYWSEYFESGVLNQSALPSAPHLETLELHNARKEDPVVLLALIGSYRAQLRKIHLNGENCDMIRAMDFPNLQEFAIDLGHSSWRLLESRRVVEELDSLKGLRTRMPNLTKLWLNLPHSYWMEFEYLFEHLLEIINLFTSSTKLTTLRLGGTLKGLKFASEEQAISIQSDHPRFGPSTLKTLEIDWNWASFSHRFDPPNYNFLIRCFPQLENLAIFTRETDFISLTSQMDYETEVDLMTDDTWLYQLENFISDKMQPENFEGEVVQVHKYLYSGEMYKSNIWELLPKLNVITYQWEVYTREEYDAYSKATKT